MNILYSEIIFHQKVMSKYQLQVDHEHLFDSTVQKSKAMIMIISFKKNINVIIISKSIKNSFIHEKN